MHRSGTSAMTRVLNLVGCAAPATLVAGRVHDNKHGFWESEKVVALNKAIDESAGLAWDDWRPISQDWLASPVKAKFVADARTIIDEEFGSSPLIVMKDPRMARLMPVWQEALNDLGFRTLFVITVRNPLEVADSLKARNAISPGNSMLSWLRHMLDAERYSRNHPRVFVRYGDLLANWRKQIDRVADAFELKWPNRSMAVEDQIDAFLLPDMRHHVYDDERVLEDGRQSPWIRESYKALSNWSQDTTDDDDIQVLDGARQALNRATPAFQRSVAVARRLEQEHRTLNKKIEDLGAKSKAAEASLAEKEKALEAVSQDRDAKEARRAKLAESLEAAEATAVEKTRELETVQAERMQLRTELEEARKAHSDLTSELESAGARAAEFEARIKEIGKERDELELARSELAQRLKTAEAQRDEQARELEEARTELKDLRDSLAHTESALAQRRAELDETTDKVDALQAQLADRDQRLADLSTARDDERKSAKDALSKLSQDTAVRLANQEAAKIELSRKAEDMARKKAELEARLSAAQEAARLQTEELATVRKVAEEGRKRASTAERDLEQERERFMISQTTTAKEMAELTRQLMKAETTSRETRDDAMALMRSYMDNLYGMVFPPRPRVVGYLDPFKRKRLERAAYALKNVGFFDADWYLKQNGDVSEAGRDPASHFIEYGYKEGRAPSARFEEEHDVY